MTRYLREYGQRRRASRRIFALLIIVAVLVIGGSLVVRQGYQQNLRPVSSSKQEVHVTILPNSSSSSIAQQLQKLHLIRSAQTFEWYVNTHNIRKKLQAGTYSFSESMSTAEIAEAIAAGKVATDLLTILPGEQLSEIKETFIDAGFSSEEVDGALNAQSYRSDYPALADNPASATLEGFLYPDSYQLTATTKPSEIIGESLKEMQKYLTSDIRTGFAKRGLTVYEGVTLASIVEQEVPEHADREKVAQVFLLRLKKGMTLGSDVTVHYARAIHNQAYNTTQHKGLPPGPIGSISESTLKAVAHPASTDWLYFLSGDNGKTYFARTYDEHKDNINRYCQKNCAAAN